MKLNQYLSVFVLISAVLAHGPQCEVYGKPVIVFVGVDDIFMLESDILPQEIDSFLAVAERYDVRVNLAVIPKRLLQVTNQDGEMARKLREFHQRGHQILQHGYNHRCAFTQATNWEFHNPEVREGYTREEIARQVGKGKKLLEEAVGAEVSTYVGPGFDNRSILEGYEALYRDLGFIMLRDPDATEMHRSGGKGYYIGSRDYAWGLNESIYDERLERAKRSFLETVETAGQWGFSFHDHFTRYGWNEGITIRWFEELLQWLTTHPVYEVTFMTFDEWWESGMD